MSALRQILTTPMEMPRWCCGCDEQIVHESSMSTVDGWLHIRCYNTARAAYLSSDPDFCGETELPAKTGEPMGGAEGCPF